MKKLFCILTCVCVLVALCAMTASAETITGSCGENVTYTLDTETGMLAISGEGDMNDFSSSSNIPWYLIKSAVIETGVTNISNTAFFGCTNLTSIEIPDSVISIGYYAFNNYDNLTIKCYEGSYAEAYAKVNNVAVEYIGSLLENEVSNVTELGIEIPWNNSPEYSSNITRKQLAVLLAQAMTAKVGLDSWNKDKTSSTFTDVTEYGTAIDFMHENGIISGTGTDTYSPDATVSYQDTLVLIIRILGYATKDMQYPYGYILAAQKLEITFENIDLYDQPLSVKQAIALVWNMLNTIVAVTDPISEEILYPGEMGPSESQGIFITRYILLEKFSTVDPPTCDFDGDGVVSVKDVLVTIKAVLNGTDLDGADMNGDGKVTLIDVLRVFKSITA